MTDKFCRACQTTKNTSEFFRDKHRPDGFYSRCKECYKNGTHLPKKKRKLVGKTQICLCCNKKKDLTFFPKRSDRHYKYEKRCRDCKNKGILIPVSPVFKGDKKKCSSCQEYKDFSEYHKCKTLEKGLSRICKDCSIVKSKKYRNSIDRDVYLRRKKQHYQKNREKHLETCREYAKNNKEKVRERHNKWQRRKFKEDPLFKLRMNISSLIGNSMVNRNVSKNTSATKILGCSIKQFKNHIESQFENWMTWDNYGFCDTNEYNCAWQLDHIIPISSAKNKEDIYMLNHWSNFQPLCSKINRKDKRSNIPLVTNLELNIDTLSDENQ